MTKLKVNFRTEELSNIVLADWNYKEDDELTKEKLKTGITENGFLQNIVVRLLPNGKYEAVDGNHRVVALNELGFKSVQVCDVGEITDEQAYMISLGLNEVSFDNNEWRLNTILKEISNKYSPEQMESILPYSQNAIEDMVHSATIDFDNLENSATNEPDDKEGFNTVTVQVKDSVFETWLKWCKKVERETDNTSKALAFEYAVVEAMNTK